MTSSRVVDMSENAVAVRAFTAHILSLRCRECGDQIVSKDGEIASTARCSSCGTVSCVGCGERILAAVVSAVNSRGQQLGWHCDIGRLGLIWQLLCSYDHQATHNKQKDVALPRRSARSLLKKRGGASGVGYGSDAESWGIDIPPNDPEAASLIAEMMASGKIPTRRLEVVDPVPVKFDGDPALTMRVITQLIPLLPTPSLSLQSEFETNPPPVLASFFLCSSLPDKLAEYLRSSLEEATQRYDLYHAVLEFLRQLASSGSGVTSRIVYSPRPINKSGHDLGAVSRGVPKFLKTEPAEDAASLFSCMSCLHEQATLLLENVKHHPNDFATADAREMMALCKEVSECVTMLRSSSFAQDNMTPATNPSNNPNAWQEDLAVLSVPDEDMFKVFYYAKEAQAMKEVAPKRMRHLFNGISILKTSLPPGIFVRYAESRLDVVKVLIVGPQGTPYENGLWEFDLFCPADYPQKPPQMNFRTTGGGRVRFNPNLYMDGKVCLSLLNTWAQNQWDPNQSTLLQVLISVQAMVLCDEPFCNEPSDNGKEGTDASKAYNHHLYADVVKYAMLAWIDGKESFTVPPSPARSLSRKTDVGREHSVDGSEVQPSSELFAEVAKKHFEVNRDKIINTVQKWVTEKQARDQKLSQERPKKKLKKASYIPPGQNQTTPHAWQKYASYHEQKYALTHGIPVPPNVPGLGHHLHPSNKLTYMVHPSQSAFDPHAASYAYQPSTHQTTAQHAPHLPQFSPLSFSSHPVQPMQSKHPSQVSALSQQIALMKQVHPNTGSSLSYVHGASNAPILSVAPNNPYPIGNPQGPGVSGLRTPLAAPAPLDNYLPPGAVLPNPSHSAPSHSAPSQPYSSQVLGTLHANQHHANQAVSGQRVLPEQWASYEAPAQAHPDQAHLSQALQSVGALEPSPGLLHSSNTHILHSAYSYHHKTINAMPGAALHGHGHPPVGYIPPSASTTVKPFPPTYQYVPPGYHSMTVGQTPHALPKGAVPSSQATHISSHIASKHPTLSTKAAAAAQPIIDSDDDVGDVESFPIASPKKQPASIAAALQSQPDNHKKKYIDSFQPLSTQKKSAETALNKKKSCGADAAVKKEPVSPDAPLREHLLRAVEDLGGGSRARYRYGYDGFAFEDDMDFLSHYNPADGSPMSPGSGAALY